MRPGDADGIVKLVVAAEMFSPDETDVVRALLDRSDGGDACLVDEQDEQLVGVAYYRPKEPADRVWDLTMIAVVPELQGTGRGSALLGRVEDDLRDRGQRLLVVDTSGTAQYDPDARLLREVRLHGCGAGAGLLERRGRSRRVRQASPTAG